MRNLGLFTDAESLLPSACSNGKSKGTQLNGKSKGTQRVEQLFEGCKNDSGEVLQNLNVQTDYATGFQHLLSKRLGSTRNCIEIRTWVGLLEMWALMQIKHDI